jgi:hypothetical protein
MYVCFFIGDRTSDSDNIFSESNKFLVYQTRRRQHHENKSITAPITICVHQIFGGR